MKKILAILLALMLAVVSVSAVAEEAAADTEAAQEETVEEETADEAEASEETEAAAEETADVVLQGLTGGRNVAFDARVNETSEAYESLKGYGLHLDGQLAGEPHFEYAVDKDSDVLSSAAITMKDGTLYLESSALGDDVYSVSVSTLVEMAMNVIDGLDIDMDSLMMLLEGALEDSDQVNLYDALPDMSTMDITPLLPALLALQSSTTIVDVANYAVNEEGDTDEDAAVEETTEEDILTEDTEETADSTVAMTVNTVLDQDTLAVINNCLAGFIAANPQLETVLGMDAEDFTDMGEALIAELGEGVCIVTCLDASGNPVSGTLSFSLDNGDGTATVYSIEAGVTMTDTHNELIITASASDDTTEDMVKLFSMDICYDAGEEGAAFYMTACLGDTETSGIGLTISVNTASDATEYDFDLSSYENGNPDRILDIQGNIENSGDADYYAYNGVMKIGIGSASQEADPYDIGIDFSLTATDPETVEFDEDAVVSLDEMTADDQEELTDDVIEQAEDVNDEVVEDITGEAAEDTETEETAEDTDEETETAENTEE